jgi:protease-4
MRHRLLRAFGLLCVAMLAFFALVFFYAYFTGGESEVLALMGGERIGVVELEGTILDARPVIENLKRFADAEGIKGVVLRIDSPGGAVGPTQEIHAEVEKLRKKKPVYASLGAVATSGGYYIASACDQIIANPGTLTGSIGVLIELGNVEELMKKLGIKGYTIKSGPYKDVGSPLQPLSPEGRAILQSVVDSVHGQFVRTVAAGRRLPERKVRELADGRVYSGEQAKNVGLVDGLGNLEDTIELLARKVGIEGRPQLVFAPTDSGPWWRRLVSEFFGRAGSLRPGWGLRYEWSPVLLLAGFEAARPTAVRGKR